MVDGAEDGFRVISVHESAGAVVDGLARDRHVVGVHNAMNEADEHPSGDEIGLPGDDEVQQCEVCVLLVSRFRIMPPDDVVGEMAGCLDIAPRREELKGPDANVAQGNAREHRSRQRPFAPDGLSRCHSCERACCRNAERRHGLADDIFAKNRAKHRAPISAPRKRRTARSLKLDIPANAVAVNDLAKKDCPAVPELGNEHAELVARIGHRERIGALRHPVARENGDALRRGKRLGIEMKLRGEPFIKPYKTRLGDLRGRETRIETLGKTPVAVVEGEKIERFSFCQERRSGVC